MTDLTPSQRAELGRIADHEKEGGIYVAYATRAHNQLAKAGLVRVTLPRVRCTPEGLEEAGRDDG